MWLSERERKKRRKKKGKRKKGPEKRGTKEEDGRKKKMTNGGFYSNVQAEPHTM